MQATSKARTASRISANCGISSSGGGGRCASRRDFRAEHGFRLRIATKYHRLVRAHLSSAEVADYQLVDSQGATEGTVANLTAEAIADITSSGETLRANHLKVIGEEPILRSQATLFRSVAAGDAGAVRDFAAQLGL